MPLKVHTLHMRKASLTPSSHPQSQLQQVRCKPWSARLAVLFTVVCAHRIGDSMVRIGRTLLA